MSRAPSDSLSGWEIDHGAGIKVSVIVLLTLATLCILTRCYIRVGVTHNFGTDDAFVVCGWALLALGTALIILMVQSGMGRHMYTLSNPEAAALEVFKWNTFYQMINVIGALTTKISIGIFILRIRNNKKLRIVLWTMITLLALSTFAVVVDLSVSCIPLRKLWEPTIPGTCSSLATAYTISYVQSGFAIVTDFLLTISPIVILWNVKIDKRRKWAICGLMSLGLIATISNALRNVYIPVLSASDITYDIIPIIIVANLEFSLGIITACLPTFVPILVTSFMRRYKSRGTKPTTGSSANLYKITPKSLPIEVNMESKNDTQYEPRGSSQSDIQLHEMNQENQISYIRSFRVENTLA